MAYDEGLAERIHVVLAPRDPEAKKMFGGVAFMVDGHMTVGIIGEDLMARVGPDDHADALAQPGAGPMEFTGRPMKGWVHIDAAAIAEDEPLAEWIDRALTFVETLPPK